MGLIGFSAPAVSVADAKDKPAQVFDRARADALKLALNPFPSADASPDTKSITDFPSRARSIAGATHARPGSASSSKPSFPGTPAAPSSSSTAIWTTPEVTRTFTPSC
jgi:hypothetical protein